MLHFSGEFDNEKVLQKRTAREDFHKEKARETRLPSSYPRKPLLTHPFVSILFRGFNKSFIKSKNLFVIPRKNF